MMRTTINWILGVWFLIFSFTVIGCGSGTSPEPGTKEIVLQINNTQISLDEFNDLLKFELYADPEMELTVECRDKFVDYLIHKELMIQNAVMLRLDQKPEFAQAIEKYWESTLIHNLLEIKSNELKNHILITDDSINQYYVQNKDDFDKPFADVKESIKGILEDEKLQEKMKEWSCGLRSEADIQINKQLMSQ